jgi:uncharacterized protein YbjQ (UPF0145 family)
MRTRILCAVLVSLMAVTGSGCHHMRAAQYAGSSYTPPAPAAEHDDDHDHEHEAEGPITPELQAAADRVLVLQGSAERACEVLGLVDVHGHMGEEQQGLARLRREAARLGGDAIVHVEFHHAGDHHDEGDADHHDDGDHVATAGDHADPDTDGAVDEDAGDPLALHLSGTVVRFRDLVAGRHYEVIRRLAVHPAMQHEEDGLDELRREARALHADLLLDVEFHHGQALEVDGTAIRFVP